MPNIDREYNRARHILNAWQSLAPAGRFAGRSLGQLAAAVGESDRVRQRIQGLEAELVAARMDRRRIDAAAVAMAQAAAAGVLGDPRHGRDSGLLRAMGYVTQSQRAKPGPKRGSRRKAASRPGAGV